MPKQLPRFEGRNTLLSTLSLEDQALISPYTSKVSLHRGMILETPQRAVECLLFPTSGVVSVAVSSEHLMCTIETGLFGFEGMSGASVLLNAKVPSTYLYVRISGSAAKIDTTAYKGLVRESWTIQRHFLKFTQSLITQTAYNAYVSRFDNIERRLARLLLMCHDRVLSDRIDITHQLLSKILAVRRSGVTVATLALAGKGLIHAERGEIHIVDRSGLEKLVGNSYGPPEGEYNKLFKL
ncbi:Crp/Fnr family transcriptional regulator (plasmid) [Paracoccus liaowanqingii]|uniref:Crp/Fnr family transcriptional regulator n=1 Tax=Paracoccus liaowanqingii TaxID=2560053 RepID=A0A4Y5SVM9_9RHOB|nr:helix-turn-helix domain-containing protein [Paracoccus liaowanqingii]QDA36865.1 Crp/Fnr family transcriptional regulator [Paracoccus liaowanqingii]